MKKTITAITLLLLIGYVGMKAFSIPRQCNYSKIITSQTPNSSSTNVDPNTNIRITIDRSKLPRDIGHSGIDFNYPQLNKSGWEVHQNTSADPTVADIVDPEIDNPELMIGTMAQIDDYGGEDEFTINTSRLLENQEIEVTLDIGVCLNQYTYRFTTGS